MRSEASWQGRLDRRAAETVMMSLLAAATVSAQQAVTSTRDVLVFTGRVDSVDRFARLLTVRTDDGLVQTVAVDPGLKVFDELKSRDRIRIRAQESVVVAVRPEAKPTGVVDTTAVAKKDLGDQGANLLQQLSAVRGRGDRLAHARD